MAQFDFIGAWTDSWQILNIILKRGDIALIPDFFYRTREPLFVTTLDERLKNMLMERRRVFLWSRHWSRFPPCLEPHPAKEMEGTYYVEFTKGGPLLDLSLPACYETDGVVNLAAGRLVLQRLYFNPDTSQWHHPSEEFKARFREVRSLIKTALVRHKIRNVAIWMGREALAMVQAGKAKVRGFGLKEENGLV